MDKINEVMLITIIILQGEAYEKNKAIKRIGRGILCFLAVLFLLGVKETNESHAATLSNPTKKGGVSTWDCVWFGNYYQSDVTGTKKDPIKWRVLSVDGDDAFLIADQNLDGKVYNTEWIDVTWANCTLRSWLNGYGSSVNSDGTDYSSNNFIDTAFTSEEQNAIIRTTVVNDDNTAFDIPGGPDTSDKVYLLSIKEALKEAYGFSNTYTVTDTRVSINTAYTASKPEIFSEGLHSDFWWLRSPSGWGYTTRDNGAISFSVCNGDGVPKYGYGVRPVLHLNLSSSNVWSYAGTVSSDGTIDEDKKPLLSNPSVSNGTSTWDCVWFGNYYQSDATGQEKGPIKWRVLSVNEKDAYLIADQNLDAKPYNTRPTDVTWKNCTLRSWLNGYGSLENDNKMDYGSNNFIDTAFSDPEQNAIIQTEVINDENPDYGTAGGEKTSDKVYLLSIAEAKKNAYGFSGTYDKSNSRIAINTAYAKHAGAYTNSNDGGWWRLRSPGNCGNFSADVEFDGSLNSAGANVVSNDSVVRPVLHLDISSETVWNYAGTVSSDGVIEEERYELTVINGTGNGKYEIGKDVTITANTAPNGKVFDKWISSNGGNFADATKATTTFTMPDNAVEVTATYKDVTLPTPKPITQPTSKIPAVGKISTVSNAKYKVVTSSKVGGTVTYTAPTNKKKTSYSVPTTVKIDGFTFKVTKINDNAFKNCKKLKSVTISANVTNIGKNAFSGCAKLNKITIKSKNIKSVGKNAFKGIKKNATIKVPKSKLKAYKKLFKKAKIAKTVKVK